MHARVAPAPLSMDGGSARPRLSCLVLLMRNAGQGAFYFVASSRPWYGEPTPVAPSGSRPERTDLLDALRRAGPSTVSDLMRAVGPERGARRKYRQVVREMLLEGEIELDRKGRLSIAVEAAVPCGR